MTKAPKTPAAKAPAPKSDAPNRELLKKSAGTGEPKPEVTPNALQYAR